MPFCHFSSWLIFVSFTQLAFTIDHKQPWSLSGPQLLSLYLLIFRFIVIIALQFYIPSRFHCVIPSIHNNPSLSSAAQTGMIKTPTERLRKPSIFHSSLFTSSIPSSSCGTNGPSLHSKKQLPDSSDSTLCHTPLGISTP